MPALRCRILEGAVRDVICAGTAELLHSVPAPLRYTPMTRALALADETMDSDDGYQEVELKLRLENLCGMIPEDHPGKVALEGWFNALVA